MQERHGCRAIDARCAYRSESLVSRPISLGTDPENCIWVRALQMPAARDRERAGTGGVAASEARRRDVPPATPRSDEGAALTAASRP